MKKNFLAALGLTTALVLAGCSSSNQEGNTGEPEESSEQLTVYTTIFPLEDFAKQIGGEYVDVKSVYPNGVDAHTYEPSTRDMTDIAEADLFFYVGMNYEALTQVVEDTMKNENVSLVKTAEDIELISSNEGAHDHDKDAHAEEEHGHEEEHAHEEEGHNHEEEHSHEEEEHSEEEHAHEEEGHEGHNHGDEDPHVWLDPIRSIQLAESVKNALIEKMPEQEDTFNKNFETLKSELTALDQEFSDTLSSYDEREILVSHAAYGYWADRYGLEQIAVTGLSPTQEPSQRALQGIIEEAQAHNIKHVLFEQNISPKVVEVIKNEIGADSLQLHNLEVATEEDRSANETYVSLMKRNLDVLKTALDK